MEGKYTNEGLPVVSYDTIKTGLIYDLRCMPADLNFQQTYKQIKNILELENPEMLRFLDMFRAKAPNERDKGCFTAGFAEAYKSLRRQAESNKLERDLD